MAEVARAANVSITTVSHVLNATRPVSKAAREAVLAAIESTGYVHNTVARSLATATTQSIGLAFSTVANPYFSELVGAIEETATAAGYTLLLADTRDDEEREQHVLNVLRQRRVDGLLVATASDGRTLPVPRSARQSVPVVLVDRLVDDRFDQVGVENEHSMSELVRHAIEHGHRRVGIVTGRAGVRTTAERTAGYRAALARAGLRHDPALEVSGYSDVDPARRAVRQLLALREPPTALVSGNNHMTVGVIRALQDAGLRIPEDVAVLTFDDVEWGDLLPSPLTSLAQPISEIGRTAVELLLSRIAAPSRAPRTVRIPPTMIRRASCGCPMDRPGAVAD